VFSCFRGICDLPSRITGRCFSHHMRGGLEGGREGVVGLKPLEISLILEDRWTGKAMSDKPGSYIITQCVSIHGTWDLYISSLCFVCGHEACSRLQ